MHCVDGADLYPYLLVNIGSGVSIVKVDGEGKYERVSGSSLGGGTFWGLCRLLTKVTNFDEMLELSMKGNNQNVGRGCLSILICVTAAAIEGFLLIKCKLCNIQAQYMWNCNRWT